MRKLVALFALSLTTSVAWAQTDKAPAVTKLPGEERLSTRERAERDFLMPVRRKKATELTKLTASAEQLATAAPETDELAHYSEATDVRAEEVATAATHVAVAHARSSRRAAWLTARRTRFSAVSAARHTSKSNKATRAKATKRSAKATHATKASRSKKATTHKAASHKTKKVVAVKAKHHTATKKVKIKAKPVAHKRRR